MTNGKRYSLEGCKRSYNKAYAGGWDFHRHQKADRAYARVLVEKCNLPQGTRLLDVGCGTGWYAHLFAEQGLVSTGVDISEAGIETAKKLHGESCDFMVADAINLPLVDAFDVVFCSDLSLYNVPDLSEVRFIGHKLLSYLVEGGTLIFAYGSNLSQTYSRGMTMHTIQDYEQYWRQIPGHHFLGSYATHAQLCLLLGKWGLSHWVTRVVSLATQIHGRSVRTIYIMRRDSSIS